MLNDRVQRALDGELDRTQLSADEAAQLDAAESMIENVLRRVADKPLPDQSAAVMNRIAAQVETAQAQSAQVETAPVASRSTWASPLDWLWRSRSLTLHWRPAYAMAGVAAIALLAVMLPGRTAVPHLADAPEQTQQVLVQFRLDAPQAEQVALAGDFSEWRPVHEMTRSGAGAWTVVVALDAGVHDYAFVVDGERWVVDPLAPAVRDGFGGENSRLAVLTPDRAAS